MIEERIKNLIKTWNSKAEQETDIFSKFVFLWFWLNAWLSFRPGQCTDRQMIDWLKNDNQSDLKRALERIKQSGGISELIELSPIRRDEFYPSQRTDICINGKDDTGNIIEAIYRIRCNLFHGRKDADDVRDQKLVEACGNIMTLWVGCLI